MKLLLITITVAAFCGTVLAQERKNGDCRIIRVVFVPLTKRPDVVRTPRLALLDVCLKDAIPQQRPVVEIERDGRRQFREFAVLRLFADRAEAEQYARENDLTDVDYGAEDAPDRLDAELSAAFSAALSGDYNEESIRRRREFTRKLKSALNDPATFEYRFEKLSGLLGIVAAPDRRLRFFSWDERTGGTMHRMTVVAQYRRPDGRIAAEELNDPELDELPAETDFVVREIYEIGSKKGKRYLIFGRGTPGRAEDFDVVRVFRIGDFGLVEDDSILPEKKAIYIFYPRIDRTNLAYDPRTKTIAYREFAGDAETGFTKPTGRVVRLKFIRGRFVEV
ncbi:MAG: hypothetical protein JSS81_12840 [Acidobacteria bacterium]|nr:hypothetical protein [Acidobacteriota bacterium]